MRQMSDVARGVRRLETRVGQLEHAVFGSTPPPAASPPVAARVTDAEAGLDKVFGIVLAVEGRTERLEDGQASIRDAVGRLEAATAAQSRAWGVGARTVRDFLASREGKKILLHVATAAAVAYAALRNPAPVRLEPAAHVAAPSATVTP